MEIMSGGQRSRHFRHLVNGQLVVDQHFN